MLKKIMKYDLEYMFKTLGVFYLVTIFMAALTRGLYSMESNTFISIIKVICLVATIILTVSLALVNIVRMWMRFRDNFYKDESYLTHTLPVKKGTLYTSKFFTSVITTIATILVIIAVIFIAFYTKDNMAAFNEIFAELKSIVGYNYKAIVAVLCGLYMVEMILIEQLGFTGIILGNRMNRDKTLYSIVFGFVAYWSGLITVLITMVAIALCNKELWNFMFYNNNISYKGFNFFLLAGCVSYLFVMGINYIINRKLLSKGVNVE